jgi:hypothetical protein
LRDYGLGWVLAALFIGSWIGQFLVGWQDFVAEASEHGQTAAVWGESGYIWKFGAQTLENWQSEFLQLLTFMVLTSFLIFRGSPESKDSDEETQNMIRSLHEEISELRRSLEHRDNSV